MVFNCRQWQCCYSNQPPVAVRMCAVFFVLHHYSFDLTNSHALSGDGKLKNVS